MLKNNSVWKTKCIRSTYREAGALKEQFYAKVLDESKEEILTQCYPGQGMDETPSWMRKSLIGVLYEIVDIPESQKPKQYSIYDYI